MTYSPFVNNTVLAGNSSTAPLNAAAVFTGAWVDVSQYDSVVVAVKTDQDGSFQVQFSPDGTNVDSALTRYYRTGQIEPPHRFTVTRQYVRVVFTNTSAANQTFLRLQTSAGGYPELNAPMDSILAQDFDATVVRPTDFHTEAALGRRQGVTTWNKFGYNDDVDVGTEVIASWGGTFQYLTAGETIDIVSSSASDAAAGVGARSLVIFGIDGNWDEQVEVVTMNGTTPVTTTSLWIGINRVAIFLAGSSASNVGTIDVTATTAGYNMARMPAGESVTQQLIFYTPRNHMFLAQWLTFNALKVSGGGSPEITFKGWVYSDVNKAKQEIFRGKMDAANANDLQINPPMPFPVSEKTILWFEATTSSNNTAVSGRFSGELFRDVDA